MNYTVEPLETQTHFIKITGHVPYVHQSVVKLQLPAWRPGRYELANYAKNIRNFKIYNKNNEPLDFIKVNKDCWQVNITGLNEFWFSYEYYANQYDAGASYADDSQIYINPVNCFMYLEGKQDEPFAIQLLVPDNYKIACQLPVTGKTINAKNFDQLADSPLIASAELFHQSVAFGSTQIHFWFKGQQPFNREYLNKLTLDTLDYTKTATHIFGELPCNNYHFMYYILPYNFRHGVEHNDSTVIAMGFTKDTYLPEFYDDLLAISCHELFHLWNVKRLRPTDMLPYDFTKENYSRLGYVYEGVTTYYGDLILLRSNVWSLSKYFESLSSDLNRHFNNPARDNYSVAESSFDTWLDGYTAGIPGRKVSIYIEGLVAAFVADVLILKATNGAKRLDDALALLYKNTYLMNKGYTEGDYKSALETESGVDFTNYFNDLIHGYGKWDKYLNEAMDTIGLTLVKNLQNGAIDCKVLKQANIAPAQEQLLQCWLNP